MTKTEIKYLVGVYACAACFMAMLCPVPVIAQIAMTFPDADIVLVQMIVAMPSLLMAFAGMAVSGFLAHRFYKKHVAMVCFIVFMLGGLMPLILHDNIYELLISSAIVGIGLGGLQNSSDALLADYFVDKKRSVAMGLFSTFVGLGGVMWTLLSANLGATNWVMAYASYLVMIPFIIVAVICLPKGKIEPKREVNVFRNIPRQVWAVFVFCFVIMAVVQLFNTNSSLLVDLRGFGGPIQAGWATTATTIAGIVAGLLVGPAFSFFKNRAIPIMFCVIAIGFAIVLAAPGIWVLVIGGFILSLGKEMCVPLTGNYTAGNSNNAGRAFNLAFAQAGNSLGMAFSPMIFGAAAAPFGDTIEAKFIIGIVIAVILAVIGFKYFWKLTPKQIEEQEKGLAAIDDDLAEAEGAAAGI